MPEPLNLHGLDVPVPEDWEDFSSYTFLVPPAVSPDPMRPTLSEMRQLQANLVVTRRAREPGQPLESYFEAANAELRELDKDFRLVTGGLGEYRGRPAVWQDSNRPHRDSGMQVHQRHIAVESEAHQVVLLTLTGDHHDLQRMSRQLGFTTGTPA